MFDIISGREIAKVDLNGDCDDLFLDPMRNFLSEGFIDVFAQTNPDDYTLKEAVPTEIKARTAFFDGNRLYLAVPKRGSHFAEVRCYRTEGSGAR